MSDVNPCIPEDVWFKILQELPVKTLGKCRCVCKSWDSLIVSPSFMAAHLKSYTQNEANSFLIYREMSREFPQYEQYVIFRDSPDVNEGHRHNIRADAYHTSVCPFKTGQWENLTKFVGSVHGLLCLSDHGYDERQIMIWNPFVRKYIYLPQSTTAMSDLACRTIVLGFGYHDRKNDHRVVKISHFRSKDGSTEPNFFVEVYSVQEREWRMIYAVYDSTCIYFLTSSHCYLKGFIHWLTWLAPDHFLDNWLFLFNVEEEKFEVMHLPDALIDTRGCDDCDFCIFEYRSKLSISCCQGMSEIIVPTSCQIWVNEEYNVESSWCKVLDIVLDGFSPTINSVKYLGSNGNIFGFYKNNGGKLVVYDPKTGQTEDLDLFQDPSAMFSTYTESLALLDQKTDVYTDYELPRLLRKFIRHVGF